MKRFILIAMICSRIFLMGISLSGCAKGKREKVDAIPVAGVQVKSGNLMETLFYVGDIKAQDEAEVYPRVSGKLLENTVKEGDRVKKDDTVAFIDRDEIGFEFEKSPVESPIEGIIGMVYLDRGVSVSSNTAIAKVVDMDIVKIRVDVVERDLPKLKVDQVAQIYVDAYPKRFFEGVVDRVSPVVDLASRTALVEIKIPNKDYRLKPGMFARVKILIREREGVLTIPRDAVIKEDSSNYVFVVKNNNKVYRQKIEVGLRENNKFEVINGLSEGEIVVTMGNTRLKEGDTVEIVDDLNIREIKEQKQ